jgi:hypothetical protein
VFFKQLHHIRGVGTRIGPIAKAVFIAVFNRERSAARPIGAIARISTRHTARLQSPSYRPQICLENVMVCLKLADDPPLLLVKKALDTCPSAVSSHDVKKRRLPCCTISPERIRRRWWYCEFLRRFPERIRPGIHRLTAV